MPGALLSYPHFCGGTYTTRSPAGDYERSMNLFRETIKSQAGKNLYNLYRTPGKKLFAQLPATPVQCEYQLNGRAWALAGNTVFEVYSNGSFIDRGTVTPVPPGQYATMVGNSANQIAICSPPNLFILNTSTNVLTQTPSGADQGLLGAQTVSMVDGFFLANAPNTPTISISNFEDGTTFQGLLQQSTQDYPDNMLAVDNYNHYPVFFGGNRSEVYYNTGSNTTLFARYEGSYQYQGIIAPWSRAKLDNTIFYLGSSENGSAVVFKLEGFVPKRVSDYSFEQAISLYPVITDAISYAYQEAGHFFYMITFPSANNGLGATWCYDVGEDTWTERGYFDFQTGQYQADLARFHMYAFGKHLVGDYQTGNLYEQSLTIPTDNGNAIRWLRRAPHLWKDNVRICYHQFIADMQIGSATATGQASEPQIFLRWSEDGGETWSNEVTATTGALGKYKTRVTVDQIGQARDMIFEMYGSDPTPELAIINAFLFLTPCNN